MVLQGFGSKRPNSKVFVLYKTRNQEDEAERRYAAMRL